MMQYVKYSCGVLTDSGGLQKEACFLGKKCITIYEHTGWKELEDVQAIYVWKTLDKEKLKEELNKKFTLTEVFLKFGNGKASEIIVNEILKYLEENKN